MFQPLWCLVLTLGAQVPVLPPGQDPPPAAEQPSLPQQEPPAPEQALPPPTEVAPQPAGEGVMPEVDQELDGDGEQPAPEPRKKKKKKRAPVQEEEEQDLPPMPASRLRPELVTAGIGAAIPLVLWLPTMGLCCSSSVMLALILPVSGFDPTSQYAGGQQRLWPTLCWMGCTAGCLGWLVSMPTAAVAGILSTLVAMIAGVAVGVARMPGQWLRTATSATAAVLAGVLATLVSVVAVGGVTLAYGFGMFWMLNQFQNTAVGRRTVRLWWTGLNVTMVAGLAGVLLVMAAAAVSPALASTGAYAAVRMAFHRMSTPPDLPPDE